MNNKENSASDCAVGNATSPWSRHMLEKKALEESSKSRPVDAAGLPVDGKMNAKEERAQKGKQWSLKDFEIGKPLG